MALGYIRPQGNAGSFQDRYFVIQTGEPVLKKDSMWICSALPGKFLAAQENEPEAPELGDIWLYTAVNQAEEGLEITLRLDGIQTKKQVVQVYQYTTAGWVMRAWKLFQSGKWVTPTCYFYRDGKYCKPFTGMSRGMAWSTDNRGYITSNANQMIDMTPLVSFVIDWSYSVWRYQGKVKAAISNAATIEDTKAGTSFSGETSFDVTMVEGDRLFSVSLSACNNTDNDWGNGPSSCNIRSIRGEYKFV